MISYTLLEFDTLDSTSDFLKENHSYFPHMTMIRTNHQEKGRGQFERVWISNKNENIMFSILLKEVDIKRVGNVKLWILESLITFINTYGINCFFKEPNDIYVDDKKLCGILIETQASEDIYDYIVVGVGLNINQEQFDGLPATSFKNILGSKQDLKKLFSKLLSILIKDYERYHI
ncbi:MAG: biotin--[acetyl-CoA-carboxylase] ligase [Acholeplasmataceae bacterium]|nr:biotin--[acetyl-CoA-carboxylase] ligase [Acholeplasmataceae bacterium]